MKGRRQAARRRMIAVVVALLAAVFAVALSVSGSDPADRRASRTNAPRALASAPPGVPPLVFAQEAPDIARASNAAVPVAPGPPTPAPPFKYTGLAVDRDAAEACLTAAVLYEAGDDPPGEKAVAQVVLNRLLHPAFPKTVCGVVQQGSERHTGCQFTFTCDGALARVPSAAGWVRARKIAADALAGGVYKPVGTATHYHTDWVVPYWRSSLEKIAIVHTQIFYRWPGAWGSRAALTGRLQPGEQVDPRIARYADLKMEGLSPMAEAAAAQPVPPALSVQGVPTAALHGNIVRLKDEDAGQFILQLDANAPSGSYAVAAFTLCGDKLECTVFGWTSAQEIPRTLPVLPWMMKTLAFAYRKSQTLGLAQGYWDCHRFPRPVAAQCLGD